MHSALLLMLLSTTSTPTASSAETAKVTPPSATSPAALTSVATVTSASGRFRLELLSATSPLRRGVQRLRVRVVEVKGGKPAQGVRLALTPWMPFMGHGIPDDTTRIASSGPGEFEVSELDLFMPGAWELRWALSGEVNDQAVVMLTLR